MSYNKLSENELKLEKLRKVIKELDRDGSTPMTSRNRSATAFRIVTIPTKEAVDLRRWVIREKAKNSIEIGLAYGYSALHICEGLLVNANPDAQHVVMDPWQTPDTGYAECGLENLKAAEVYDMVEFHGAESQLTLPEFLKENRKFDFAFVDGNHRFDAVFLDLYFLGRLVKKGGIIILDDYQLPGIKKAAGFFVSNIKWIIEEEGQEHDRKWVVLRTPETEDTRDFRFFLEF